MFTVDAFGIYNDTSLRMYIIHRKYAVCILIDKTSIFEQLLKAYSEKIGLNTTLYPISEN